MTLLMQVICLFLFISREVGPHFLSGIMAYLYKPTSTHFHLATLTIAFHSYNNIVLCILYYKTRSTVKIAKVSRKDLLTTDREFLKEFTTLWYENSEACAKMDTEGLEHPSLKWT